MVDEFAQKNHLPGRVIDHVALNEYISRNYASDNGGRYFFQNGPQRVFITLVATPWVARMIPGDQHLQLLTQCQSAITPTAALSDEQGNIYIVGAIEQTVFDSDDQQHFSLKVIPSVALLHDHDLDQFSELAKLREEACSFGGSWLWQGKQLPLDPIHSDELSQRFGFIKNPKPL